MLVLRRETVARLRSTEEAEIWKGLERNAREKRE
jgi:hypothetical protein